MNSNIQSRNENNNLIIEDVSQMNKTEVFSKLKEQKNTLLSHISKVNRYLEINTYFQQELIRYNLIVKDFLEFFQAIFHLLIYDKIDETLTLKIDLILMSYQELIGKLIKENKINNIKFKLTEDETFLITESLEIISSNKEMLSLSSTLERLITFLMNKFSIKRLEKALNKKELEYPLQYINNNKHSNTKTNRKLRSKIRRIHITKCIDTFKANKNRKSNLIRDTMAFGISNNWYKIIKNSLGEFSFELNINNYSYLNKIVIGKIIIKNNSIFTNQIKCSVRQKLNHICSYFIKYEANKYQNELCDTDNSEFHFKGRLRCDFKTTFSSMYNSIIKINGITTIDFYIELQ